MAVSLYEQHRPREATVTVSASPDFSGDFICDGVLDGVEVQAAVTFAGAVNGSVYFLQGAYVSAAEAVIDVPEGIVIEGSSDKTVTFDNIRFELASVNVDAGDIVFRNFRVIGDDIGCAITVSADDCTVSNILIENVEATITGATGRSAFELQADNDAIVENVRFYNCKALDCSTFGFMLYDGTSTGSNTIRDIWFIACEAINCGKAARVSDWVTGFDFSEGDASFTVENVFAHGCIAEGSWESGFHNEPMPMKTNIWYINCTSNDNGNDKPIVVYGHGFHIMNGTSAIGCKAYNNGKVGINATGLTYAVLSGNICSENAEYGIHVYGSSINNTVTGNVCEGNTERGISIIGSDNIAISGNTCEGNTGQGIYLYSSSGCTVGSNICQGNGSHGIHFPDGSLNNAITGNTCNGNALNGIQLSTTANHNVVTGNTCNGNTQNGIYISLSHDCALTGNTCNGNTQNGIQLLTSNNNTVTGNTCNENIRNGIYVFNNANNNTLTGNTCNKNDVGNTNTYDGINIENDSDYNLVMCNTCNENDRWGISIGVAADDCVGNWVKNNHLRGNTSGPFIDNGTDTKLATLPIQLIQGTTFISTADEAWGWLINADTNFALGIGWLPLEVQQVVRIRVIGVGLAAPGAADAYMKIQITGEGATFDEVYTTEPIDVIDKNNEEDNFAVDDVINWVFTATDDADIGHLLGGDRLQIKVLHEGGDAPHIETNAIVDSIQVEYV